jgi:hypothetical protein
MAGYGVTACVFDRVTGAFLSAVSFDQKIAAETIAVDQEGFSYLLTSDGTAAELTKLYFDGQNLNLVDQTASYPGQILLGDPYNYDSQHGPVLYGAAVGIDDTAIGRASFVAFSLADVAGISGGVYAFDVNNLATPIWTALTGLQTPVLCSGLSVVRGMVVFSYQDPLATPDAATDTYLSRVAMYDGATGVQLWSSGAFNGRVGSAFTISDNSLSFGQARYQFNCSAWQFDLSVPNDPGQVISAPGTAGAGPVSLAGYLNNTVGLYYMNPGGGISILH